MIMIYHHSSLLISD